MAAGLFACHPDSGTVTGTATYRERIGLPGDAVFEARLVDLSAKPGEKRVLASDRIAPIPGLPIGYTLKFARAAIKPGRAYGVEARIEVGKQVWFVSPAPVPVLTQGHGERADLILSRSAGPASIGAPPETKRQSTGEPEAVASAIDKRLAKLTRLEGRYRDDGHPASYAAYIERGAPVLIKVGRQGDGGGSAALSFYYENGILIRCVEDRLERGAGRKDVVHLVLDFANGAYAGGTKTVNGGKAARPEDREAAGAKAMAEAVRERVVRRLKTKASPR